MTSRQASRFLGFVVALTSSPLRHPSDYAVNGPLYAAEWAWRSGVLVLALAVTVVEVVGHIVRPTHRKPHRRHEPRAN